MTQHMGVHASVQCMSAVLYVKTTCLSYPEEIRVSALHCGRICFESRLKTRPSRQKFLVISNNILQAIMWVVFFVITS